MRRNISNEWTSGYRTMSCVVDVKGAETLNALSACKDSSAIAVAGRNVLRIFSVGEGGLEEKINLRIGRMKNTMNYSSSDVVWHPTDDNILATSATNGAVITWNLGKKEHSKLDQIYNDHKRTVNRVNFHPTEASWLLSGSQDGTIKMFDIKKEAIKEKDNATSTFCTQNSTNNVRDVQFSSSSYFIFAAAFDNGCIQLWDVRNPKKRVYDFTAHNGPAFSLDWHPDEKNLLATSGRDKFIKVWDLINPQTQVEAYSIQTISSVARVKWRPEKKYHIACCYQIIDFSVSIWDIRRPYIPFATFEEHKDVTTGIAWKRKDPHIFFSVSKDKTLYQHVFKDAKKPQDKANKSCVDINIFGDVCQATPAEPGGAVSSQGKPANYLTFKPASFKRSGDSDDNTKTIHSSLFAYPVGDRWSEVFCRCATGYQLYGMPLAELCSHNAQVAEDLELYKVAQTWRMLKLIYATADSAAAPAKSHLGYHRSASGAPSVGHISVGDSAQASRNLELPGYKQEQLFKVDHHQSKSASSEKVAVNDEMDTDTDENEPEHIASGLQGHDLDPVFDQTEETYDLDLLLDQEVDWSSLPQEAIPSRHAIMDRSPSPAENERLDSLSTSCNESEGLMSIKNKVLTTTIDPCPTTFKSLHFDDIVAETLKFHAERGDVQTSVSALIVLRNSCRLPLEELLQVHWFTSYLDLLSRFRLWLVANQVVKLSRLEAVGAVNQNSTTFHTGCNRCKRPLRGKVGWCCEGCQNLVNTCSVCHHIIKGLYVWCQGCSHGGHLKHIQEWLANNEQCPAGCGHLCEY